MPHTQKTILHHMSWFSLCLSLCFVPQFALAEAGDARFKGRLLMIEPNGDGGGRITSSSADTSFGIDSNTRIEGAWTFSFEAEYDIADRLSVETSVPLPSDHELIAQGASLVNLSSGTIANVSMMPVTTMLKLQLKPDAKLQPYIGVGFHYTWFQDVTASSSFNNAVNGNVSSFQVDTDFSWAVQAGVNFTLNEDWFFNFDFKYLDLNTKASFFATGFGQSEFDLDIDPFLIGFAVGKTF